MDQRKGSVPTFALVRVVRGDVLRVMNCPLAHGHCMFGFLACSEAYEFGQLGISMSLSSKYTFPKADELKKNPTVSLRGDTELRLQSEARSSCNYLLSSDI